MRKFWLLGIVAVLALALAGFSLYQVNRLKAGVSGFYGTPLEDPVLIDEITLTAADGEQVSLSDYRGELLLVFFGYTNCPDVCPLTMARLANIYEGLGEPEDVQVVMITVDPARDTPEVVENYVNGFHSSFVGLSGTPAEIADATRTFFIGYRGLDDGGVIHTDTVALLDRDGRMRLVYGQSKMIHLQDDLRKILENQPWS